MYWCSEVMIKAKLVKSSKRIDVKLCLRCGRVARLNLITGAAIVLREARRYGKRAG